MRTVILLMICIFLNQAYAQAVQEKDTTTIPAPPDWAVVDPSDWKIVYSAMTDSMRKYFHITKTRMLWEWVGIYDRAMHLKNTYGKPINNDLWFEEPAESLKFFTYNKSGKIIAMSFKIRKDFNWRKLEKLQQLKHIEIEFHGIKKTDLNLENISFPKGIESISIWGAKIKGLGRLNRLKKLTSLSIDRSLIDLKGIKSIDSLKNISISLIDNFSKKDFNKLFKNTKNLSSISLEVMPIHQESVDFIGDKFPNLKHLKLEPSRKENFISSTNFLSKMPQLKELFIDSKAINSMNDIPALPNLEKLVSKDTNISDLTGIHRFPKLKKINLIGNGISDLKPLSALKNLEEAILFGNPIKRIEGFENSPNLRRLHLWDTSLEKIDGLQNNTNLEFLEIGGHAINKIENISHLSKLKTLNFDGCSINTTTGLPNPSSLEVLRLDCKPGQYDLSGLKNQPNLREFYCTNCKRVKTLSDADKKLLKTIKKSNYDFHKNIDDAEKKALKDLRKFYKDYKRKHNIGVQPEQTKP